MSKHLFPQFDWATEVCNYFQAEHVSNFHNARGVDGGLDQMPTLIIITEQLTLDYNQLFATLCMMKEL